MSSKASNPWQIYNTKIVPVSFFLQASFPLVWTYSFDLLNFVKLKWKKSNLRMSSKASNLWQIYHTKVVAIFFFLPSKLLTIYTSELHKHNLKWKKRNLRMRSKASNAWQSTHIMVVFFFLTAKLLSCLCVSTYSSSFHFVNLKWNKRNLRMSSRWTERNEIWEWVAKANKLI